MTNKKTTKRALLASVIAMLLCFAMLLGTTFAWFTDSASSAGNKIQSGTLDVDLVDADGKSMEGQVINFVTPDNRAQDEILWEPGCTYDTEPVYVVNEGNLALKYEITINGIKGDAKLLEAIEWTVIVNGVATPLAELNGTLLPNAKSGAIILRGHMKEEAGNEYMNKTIEGISITVVAGQYTYESDSFNNQYDKGAIIYDKLVTTDDELTAAIVDPNVKIIAINGDLTYDWGRVTDGATALKGITLVGYNGTADSITFKGYGSGNSNNILNVTLQNITVKNETTVGDTEKTWNNIYLEFNTLTANNVVFENGILLKGDSTLTKCSIKSEVNEYGVWIQDGKATLNECTFTGARGVKIHEQYYTDGRLNDVKTVVIDGCIFMNLSKPGVAIDSLDTQITIKNSTFINCQAGDQGLYIYESDNTEPTLKNNTVLNDAAQFTVSTAAQLQEALTPTVAEGDLIVNLASDIELAEGETWTPLSLNTYTDVSRVVINGNGHTIKELNAPLIDNAINGGTEVVINNLTLENSTVNSASDYAGAFVAIADNATSIKLFNCKLVNSTVESADYAGGLIGYVSGTVTLEGCSVTGCTISGESVGSLVGMISTAKGNETATISSATVTGNTLTSVKEGTYRVGELVGTANIEYVELSGITASNNTCTQSGSTGAEAGMTSTKWIGRTSSTVTGDTSEVISFN